MPLVHFFFKQILQSLLNVIKRKKQVKTALTLHLSILEPQQETFSIGWPTHHLDVANQRVHLPLPFLDATEV